MRFPEHVSEAVVRAAAAGVFVLTILGLVLGSPWPALVLATDFGLRVFAGPRWSPLSALARLLIRPPGVGPGHGIPYPPKRFAAGVGFALAGAGFLLGLVGVPWGFYGALGVLGLFSALESFVGFCAGCSVYGLLMRWRVVPEHSCPQCRLS